MEEVRVIYMNSRSHEPLYCDDIEQRSITVAVPTAVNERSENQRTLTVSCVVEAARRQLHLGMMSLQLSLHGIVLFPQQDLLQLLKSLPPGTRTRVVFVLTPADKENGKRSEEPVGETKQVRFAEQPCLSSEEVTLNSVDGRTDSTCVFQKEVKLDAKLETTASPACVFRETWLNPQICAYCHGVRGRHSLFSPGRKERFEAAMSLAKKKTSTCLPPQQAYTGQSGLQKLVLPYYYADPQQWRPQRDGRFCARAEACDEFFQLWGNPALCARCHRAKGAHKPEAVFSTPRRSTPTPARRVRKLHSSCGGGVALSSAGYAQRPCLHRDLSLSGGYCRRCCQQRVRQMMQTPAERQPLVELSPRQHRQQRRTTLSAQARTHDTKDGTSTASCSERELGRRGQRPRENGGETATDATGHIDSSFSSFPPFSLARLSTAITSLLQETSGPSSSHIPWGVVLQYAGMEELLTCMAVSKALRAVAIPLLHENCKYIIYSLDLPVSKRKLLAGSSAFYASVILDTLRYKRSCSGPMRAATNPLYFFRYCVLRLFDALQAVQLVSGKQGVLENNNSDKASYALATSPMSLTTALLTDAAVSVVLKGAVCSKDPGVRRLTYLDEDLSAVEFLINNVAWCDLKFLSQEGTKCISKVFELISVAAAASVVSSGAEDPTVSEHDKEQHTRFLSLGSFFEKHALMPLVDFLLSVEVIAKMKWRARRCLEWLQCNQHCERLL